MLFKIVFARIMRFSKTILKVTLVANVELLQCPIFGVISIGHATNFYLAMRGDPENIIEIGVSKIMFRLGGFLGQPQNTTFRAYATIILNF